MKEGRYFLLVSMAFGLIILTGCEGCLSRFYKVHEEIHYLDITFTDSSLSPKVVLQYLDSVVKKDSIHYGIDSVEWAAAADSTQRVLIFKEEPRESYQVSCDAHPCWIMAIENPNLDADSWIYDRKKLSENQLNRIQSRFQVEILDKIRR